MSGKAGAQRWTDTEKASSPADLALCVAIINQAGAGNPKWASLPLPEGRTVSAAQQCWASLKKNAEGIQLTDTPKKRAPSKAKSATEATSTPKRKRGTKAKDIAKAENEDDKEDNEDGEEASEAKRTKTDGGEDGEEEATLKSKQDEEENGNEEKEN